MLFSTRVVHRPNRTWMNANVDKSSVGFITQSGKQFIRNIVFLYLSACCCNISLIQFGCSNSTKSVILCHIAQNQQAHKHKVSLVKVMTNSIKFDPKKCNCWMPCRTNLVSHTEAQWNSIYTWEQSTV